MKNKNDFLKNYILERGENKHEKSSNLYINNYGELINYYTKIAYFKNDTLYLNISKYSSTTTRNQNTLKRYANYYNVNIIEYEA